MKILAAEQNGPKPRPIVFLPRSQEPGKPECSYNKLVVIWDEAKRRNNLEKHGLDFVDANLVYDSPSKITFQSPRKAETRLQDSAMVAVRGRVLTLVYVERGAGMQAISFRVASRKERELYEQAQDQEQD